MNLTNYLNLNSWLPLKVFWLSELPSLFLMAFSNWRCSKNCRKRKILVSIWMEPDETLAPQRNECFAYSPSAGPGCITLPGSIPMPIQLILLLCLLQSCTGSWIPESGNLEASLLGGRCKKLSYTWDVYKLLPESFWWLGFTFEAG